MAALWILLGIIGFILLALCLPVFICIVFDSGSGFALSIKYCFITFQLIPQSERAAAAKERRTRRKHRRAIRFRNRMLMRKWTRILYYRVLEVKALIRRKKAERIRAEKAKKSVQPEKKKNPFSDIIDERGVGGLISWILELAKIAAGAFAGIWRGIFFRRFDLHILTGGSDAAEAAIGCGRLCALLFPALSVIMNASGGYRRDISILPDYDNDEASAQLNCTAAVFPIAVIHHALVALFKILFNEIKRIVSQRMAEQLASDNESADKSDI